MSVDYSLSINPHRVLLNPYPHPSYTNQPFYVKYPFYTNNMIYNYSPNTPFYYTYGLESSKCLCDVYHTLAECLEKKRYFNCP
jgi:hypothetical protein